MSVGPICACGCGKCRAYAPDENQACRECSAGWHEACTTFDATKHDYICARCGRHKSAHR